MISSGGASLRSWHQLYSRIFICVKYLGFEPLTAGADHAQPNWSSQALSLAMA